MATFTVDTHLFRELGELLVGRDSTALIELIKNCYDADATQIVVYGEALSSTTRGFIRIQDNGIGMSKTEFENGFLRIASRTKDTNRRRSLVFFRRYTGAKGIGRLAAHKLATLLEIASARWDDKPPSKGARSASLQAGQYGLEAVINWNEIEKRTTLEDVDASDAIVVKQTINSGKPSAGTTVTLRRLRKAWSKREHGRFLEELQAFEAPKAISSAIPSRIVRARLLFDEPKIRDVEHSFGSSFQVRLEGELAPPDDYWTAIIDAANWIIEIDAQRGSGKVHFAIAPTAQTLADLPDAEVRRFVVEHPHPKDGPFFQARILKRVGPQRGETELRQWAGRISGVRVYMEGFRVLPYGEIHNDWLSLDRDNTTRGRTFLDHNIDEELISQFQLAEREGAGLLHLPNRHYFGGVFLTERSAPTLRMLVNREGFVPDEGYQTLVDLVRQGVDLSTRVQAAANAIPRRERRALRASQKPPETETSSLTPISSAIATTVIEAKAHASAAKRFVASGEIDAAGRELQTALANVEKIASVSSEIIDENAMIRVLASVGTQLASFIHELNGLLSVATGVDKALQNIRNAVGLRAEHKRELGVLSKSVGDLRRTIEKQSSYLLDIVSPDARRRRSKQNLYQRFEAGVRLITFAAEKRSLKIINRIPEDLRSPPMFPAEATAVFSNLLTNAVKAAGKKGRIRATGRKGRGATVIRVENTGTRVRLREAERWFRPFESSTGKVDPLLGQGMGLGLPITRSMLEEYGATIKFVEPTDGFATAVEISFPD
jgi:signal transduction histidine kinase